MQNDMQTFAAHYMSSVFMQKVCSTASPIVDWEAINTYHHLTPDNVDAVIDVEMKKVMAKYTAEEESFVDQKLVENPVVCERRSSTRSGSESSSSRDPIQQQRAESCRKSRINNKIKKAKSKFRHKFITMKLAQNAATLEGIREVIAHAEARLRSSGYSEAELSKLRSTMGVDRVKIENLSEITKQLTAAVEN